MFLELSLESLILFYLFGIEQCEALLMMNFIVYKIPGGGSSPILEVTRM